MFKRSRELRGAPTRTLPHVRLQSAPGAFGHLGGCANAAAQARCSSGITHVNASRNFTHPTDCSRCYSHQFSGWFASKKIK